MKKILKPCPLYVWCVVLVVMNVGLSLWHAKWDMTDQKRFTLTPATVALLQQVRTPIHIEVLLDGSVKASTKYFVRNVEELLLEFQAHAPMISFAFQNPFGKSLSDSAKMYAMDSLTAIGLSPYTLRVQQESMFEQSQSVIIPGAVLQTENGRKSLNFFQGLQVSDEEALFARAASSLEYKFARTIAQLARTKKPKIYFNASHNEPMDMRMIEFFQTVAEEYEVDTLNLVNAPSIPNDASVWMTFLPSTAFTEEEKIKIDHYIMRGGRALFWLNATGLDDSKATSAGDLLFVPRDLNLEDLLFRYGCRVQASLVKDLQCATMPVVVGHVGDKPQIESINWTYYPILSPDPKHVITKHLDPILSKYPNWIDTLPSPSILKTPLLYSSEKSQIVGTPALVSVEDAKLLDPQLFTRSHLPVAMLLEGNFPSLYFDRLTEEERKNHAAASGVAWRAQSLPTTVMVVANPQIIINEVSQRGIIPMGYAKDMNFLFANKSFLMNSLSYLENPKGLIVARQKDVAVQLLNIEKVKEEASFWRFINLLIPMLILLILGGVVKSLRLR